VTADENDAALLQARKFFLESELAALHDDQDSDEYW
jgi:hypothetical protein